MTLAFPQTNPTILLDDMEAALVAFKQRYPTYELTQPLDVLRSQEYGRLDKQGHVYLDYTGGGLYAESQLKKHMSLLHHNVFGNPHSHNPTSSAMTNLVESTRRYILTYFNADPDSYTVIFTANASGALKLVGESYPFSSGSCYLLTTDNHNSVNGIREFARSRGASVDYVPLTTPDLRIDGDQLQQLLAHKPPQYDSLFAYPAQSNFSGVQHDLTWIQEAKTHGWDVLLDAAAFVPTNRLDISLWQPDFVTISFYKMFGYPTGIGCLIARKETLGKLQRPWFAGGTVNFVSTQHQKHRSSEDEAAFEDGTIDYLNIPAVRTGLVFLKKVGLDTIHDRVACLTSWLLDTLQTLQHTNGAPLVRIYGPSNGDKRGGTITVNFYDPNGRLIDYRRIEELANGEKISLRTGCFCNPGANETAEGLTRDEMEASFAQVKNITLPLFRTFIEHEAGKNAGAIRISVGLVSNFADVYHFVQFAYNFIDKTVEEVGTAHFDSENCRVTEIRDSS